MLFWESPIFQGGFKVHGPRFNLEVKMAHSRSFFSEKKKKRLGIRLIEAAKMGDVKTVEKYVEKGADLAAEDDFGFTALAWAALKGHVGIAQALIDKGANLEAAIHNGSTVLACAALKGHVGVVQMLIDKGADPNAANHDGLTALAYASREGHREIEKILTEASTQVGGTRA
jgi:ankyrin repeat protein